MSRLSHLLDNQITDGSEVVSLMHWPRFLELISVRGLVNPKNTVQLEGLSQLKYPMTSSGTEPMTFRLVVWYLNQLHYCVPPEHLLNKSKFLHPQLSY
jgi:hypothetical protein